MKIELGCKAKDIITGFEGVITGRAEYLTGCVQYVVTPDRLDKDGKRLDGEWHDEGRLVVTAPPQPELMQAMGRSREETPGGPQRDAPACR